ncbi:MAG: methyltransferase domain-containing protein [Deltaproteobacteria bacterium]|nr:methyltransferase domain-containing protein [Deltaproteobacteria bacterium]
MTENRFDSAAEDWDKESRRVELSNAISSRIALLPLNDGMKAMEYGCGTGLVGLNLARHLASLVAADSSPGMLEIIKTKIVEQGIKNVFPQRLDLQHDDCEHDFDLIFSAMTLHHLTDVNGILAKFFQCLKPGGILALADLDEEDGSFHQDNPEGVMHHGFNRKKLAGDLEKIGFTSIQESTVHTILKKNNQGGERPYPVFLMIAMKE